MEELFVSAELRAILALHPVLNEKFKQLEQQNAPKELLYSVLEELAAAELARTQFRPMHIFAPCERFNPYY